jgi:hypothetical protein
MKDLNQTPKYKQYKDTALLFYFIGLLIGISHFIVIEEGNLHVLAIMYVFWILTTAALVHNCNKLREMVTSGLYYYEHTTTYYFLLISNTYTDTYVLY